MDPACNSTFGVVTGMVIHEEVGMCKQPIIYDGQIIPESERFCLEN